MDDVLLGPQPIDEGFWGGGIRSLKPDTISPSFVRSALEYQDSRVSPLFTGEIY